MRQSESGSRPGIVTDSYGPGIRLTIGKHHLLGRATLEHKPPRMHQVKAAVSIARQVARRAANPPNETIFYGPVFIDELSTLSLMMPEVTRVKTAAMSLSGFLDGLLSLRNPCTFVVVGEARAPRDELVIALANVIDGLSAETRGTVLDAVLERLDPRRESVRGGETEITIQEKPGKFSSLQLPDDAAIRQAIRRVQGELANLRSQHDYVAKIAAEDGWAAGGLVVEEVGSGDPRAVYLNAATFRWHDRQLSLDMPAAMASAIISWFKEASGVDPAGVAQIYASAQSVTVAGRLALELCAASGAKKRPAIFFPDFGLGWMPVATVLAGLAEAKPPAIFIFCERFPDVEVLAVWR